MPCRRILDKSGWHILPSEKVPMAACELQAQQQPRSPQAPPKPQQRDTVSALAQNVNPGCTSLKTHTQNHFEQDQMNNQLTLWVISGLILRRPRKQLHWQVQERWKGLSAHVSTLYLHACQVKVTVSNSGLCCCTCVTSFQC